MGQEVQQILWNLKRDQQPGQYSMQLDIQNSDSVPRTFGAILDLGNLLQKETDPSPVPSGRLVGKTGAGKTGAHQFNLDWAPEALAKPRPLLKVTIPKDSD